MSNENAMTAEALAKYITEATTIVFSRMVQMRIAGGPPLEKMVTRFKSSITGMIGLAGTYSGLVSIHCPVDLATKIAAQMLMMEPPEVDDEDVLDAIKEISNMIGGSVKQVLSKSGLDIHVSIPTALTGDDYIIDEVSDSSSVMIPFDCEDSRFLVGLKLKKESF